MVRTGLHHPTTLTGPPSLTVVGKREKKDSSRADEIGECFVREGYVIAATEDLEALAYLSANLSHEMTNWMKSEGVPISGTELARSHESITTERVNALRLHLFAHLNAQTNLRERYYGLASKLLSDIVGNELAMQTKVNLSIQQPDDLGSVLDIHSDVWTGDSPFQVVLWVPLTETTGTNAMFFLPPEPSYEAYRRVRAGELRSMAEVRAAYDPQISVIEMKVGQVLVFNSNCLHGNRVNTTTTSRWSLNCRFVNLLAPATNPERRLGSYYTPLTVRPATRMGLRAIDLMGLKTSTPEP
jgi:sporadic carbohydrate cluster 2OG-Fe(II) oxygenase